jgi:hypothetical protein
MPSPDFSNYIDLTINDEQPGVIYENAIDYARIALPEFSPRPGTVEDAILQATSFMAGITLGAVNRLPDGLMEGIMRLLGVVRREATFGSIDIDFLLSGTGLTIEQDTVVYYQTTDGDITVQYPFILETETTASVGLDTVTATLTSQVAGILPSIPIGTVLNLAQASTAVLSATTASEVTQGNRAESQIEYFNRATTSLESLSSCLSTSRQVENYILSNYSEVHRCKVYDLAKAVSYNPGADAQNATKVGATTTVLASQDFVTDLYSLNSQLLRVVTPSLSIASYEDTIPSGHFTGASVISASPVSSSIQYTDSGTSGTYGPVSLVAADSLLISNVGENPGHFIIFLCDSAGEPVLQSIKDSIYTDVAERITAGLSFTILDAFPLDVDFTITISVDAEFGASTVAETVASEMESYMSLANWPNWSSFIRVFDIVARVSRIAGVEYVYSVLSSIPDLAGGAMSGNDSLVTTVTDGSQLIGYEILYAGIMPRASVEVLVI